MNFLVTGATGNAGGQVVRALAEDGHAVRALTRSPDRGRWPATVEPVGGDLDHPGTLAGPLAGVDGVFLMSGYADMPALLAEIRRAGVGRVVLLSSSSVPLGDRDNAVVAYHALSEQAVRESGLAHTVLRPSMFMTNALQWADQLAVGDVVRVQWPAVAAAVVDPYDVGAVAASVLVAGGHDGAALRLTGPEALLPADRVRILGEVLGRDLHVEELSDEQTLAELRASMPPRYVEAFSAFYLDGTLDESPVLPTVREVLGREARDFAVWAAEHAAAFGAGSAGVGPT
jgi:uncharacterized protein YbjT (DUF2867 family)